MKLGNTLQNTILILSVFTVILLVLILFFVKKEYFQPTPTNNYNNFPDYSSFINNINSSSNIPEEAILNFNPNGDSGNENNFSLDITLPSDYKLPTNISLNQLNNLEQTFPVPTNITLLTNATAPS